MEAAADITWFALDRVRTILLALSLIVLLKAGWIMVAPALDGFYLG